MISRHQVRWALVAACVLTPLLFASCRYAAPQKSPVPASPGGETLVLWSGAVTPTSARVTAVLPVSDSRAAASVTLHVDTLASFQSALPPVRGQATDDADGAMHFHLQELTPATTYHYRLIRDGAPVPESEGRFRTFEEGASSFRVVMSGCAETGSRHPVFQSILDESPDLFLHLGDMHYEDIDMPEIGRYRRALAAVHASPEQARLYRSVPLAYMWDDHDYGPNNSSSEAVVQETARRAYRRYIPHYPLASGSDGPVQQRFSVGRVRFLMTDLRSARTRNDAPDTEAKTMLGAEQYAWFRDQLQEAADDDVPLLVWVSSVPWIANDPGAWDRWSGFATEREDIARHIDSLGLEDQMVIVSGDAHMSALDDGTNNTYGPGDGIRVPVIQAAALDRIGSVKGGPYTIGPFPNRFSLRGANDGQYVRMDVDDRGDTICATWTGRRWAYDDEAVVDLFSWSRCFGG